MLKRQSIIYVEYFFTGIFFWTSSKYLEHLNCKTTITFTVLHVCKWIYYKNREILKNIIVILKLSYLQGLGRI